MWQLKHKIESEIKKLNESIDIPMINEKTEKKVLDKVYGIMVDTLETLV